MHEPRVHAIERRLGADVIQQLVQDYATGTPSTELTGRYGIGKGTVLKLLRGHGVTIRRQGLSPAENEEAIQTYRVGWSLAKFGGRFGHEHTVVRKALLDAGIQPRPRNGWPG